MDDSLIFCKAVKEESEVVKGVLESYGKASGQLVNTQKSSIFFSSNTPATRRTKYKEILDDLRKAALMYVKDMIVNKARSWNGRRVNPAGKEVLANSVLLTTPTYVMACVKISRGLCRMLNSIIAKKKIGMAPRI